MKIFAFSFGDWSGSLGALAQAVQTHTTHQFRWGIKRKDWLRFPRDLYRPSDVEVLKWLEWCDVLNIHSTGGAYLPKSRIVRPTVWTMHGSWYRRQIKKLNAVALRERMAMTCLTVDLSLYGPRWIGRAMPDMISQHNPPTNEFVVMQAPTNLEKKGTALVREALAGLPGVRLDVVTHVPNHECLLRKSRVHVLVDQVGPRALGYGTNAVEAWSYGIPVISSGPFPVLEHMQVVIGFIPFVVANDEEAIRSAVRNLQRDAVLYQRWQMLGRRCWEEHHKPQIVAQQFIEICEQSMTMGRGA